MSGQNLVVRFENFQPIFQSVIKFLPKKNFILFSKADNDNIFSLILSELISKAHENSGQKNSHSSEIQVVIWWV